ncbi:hypothetical protein OH76DRAFT_1395620 [Lentinus brumalis]|uniref:F-box domain-containing protein n=1 Tax=Lentinus brumalis TaxID=2498619 RepID=A0A371DVB3_9APHY|nr:hypothetical protein OH76DRAFT_1395620 [Polyporus brumalis]
MSSCSTQNLRRSSRLGTKQYQLKPEPTEQPKRNGSTSGSADIGERPTKRRRRNANAKDDSGSCMPGKGSRRKKSLSMLPDMPLDILYEIFAHLHPYDLLHLTRTTKPLRVLLMNRSATTVWKRARENVPGLPDCPPDLSEPAFANLAFDPHCHFCIKARVWTVMWTLRVRCCKTCLKDSTAVVTLGEVFRALPRYNPLKTKAMLPIEYLNDSLYCLTADLNKLLELLDACNHDKDAFEALATERTNAAKMQKESGIELEAWRLAEISRRKEEKTTLTLRRRIQILQRLSDSGYAEELKYVPDDLYERFTEKAVVNQPKEITDRIWNNIKESMLLWAEEVRTHYLMWRRSAHYINRLSMMSQGLVDIFEAHPFPQIVPSVADLSWHIPFYRDLMEKDRDVAVTLEDLVPENMGPFLEGLVILWRVDMAQRLYPLIPAEARPTPEQFECTCGHHRSGSGAETSAGGSAAVASRYDLSTMLKASTTWFRCTVEGCLLDFPRILTHECAKRAPPLNLHPQTQEDDLRNAYNLALGEAPWNFAGDAITYDMEAHRATQNILRLVLEDADKEPWKTDKFALDDLDKRFVCGECSADGMLCVMPWRVAVEHLTSDEHAGNDVTLTVLNEADRTWVVDQEPELSQDMIIDVWKMWGCVECRSSVMTLNDILEHMVDDHDMAFPQVGVDYHLHPDAATFGDAPASEMYYPEGMFTTSILR